MSAQAFDLIIVGGGIAGSGLATVMARAGYTCLVLEKSTAFPDQTKGEWIAPWGVVEARRTGLHDVLAGARGHVLRRHIGYDETREPAQAEAATLPLGILPGVEGPMTQRHPDACQVLFDAAGAAGATNLRGVQQIEVSPGPRPTVRYRHDGVEQTARARLVVAADGRNSAVRRELRVELHRGRPHHMFSGLLVDGACAWPEDLETAGTEDDLHFLAFPQGGGRVRLYLGFGLEQRSRFAGPEGPRRFLDSFRFLCIPEAERLAEATAVSPCASYPNEDAWTETPYVEGVVLLGDAAGWNDPIIGQGLSITLRDVRVLSEILTSTEAWTVEALRPYAEERAERMRRLRFAGELQSALHNEFGEAARARRVRAQARMAADPTLSLPLLAVWLGPETPPAEAFTEQTRSRILE